MSVKSSAIQVFPIELSPLLTVTASLFSPTKLHKAAIVSKRVTSQNSNYAKIAPKLLWTNPNPGNSMGATTITLNSSGANYSYYQILALMQTASNINAGTMFLFTFQKGSSTRLTVTLPQNGYTDAGSGAIAVREVTGSSNTNITVGSSGYKVSAGGSGSWITSNNWMIPYKIFGYNVV